jgi:hypothetical protein
MRPISLTNMPAYRTTRNRNSAAQRQASTFLKEKTEAIRAEHDHKMRTDPRYRGEVDGEQTAVEDRRTNSLNPANRVPSPDYVMRQIAEIEPTDVTLSTGQQRFADFIEGFSDGYFNAITDEEWDTF